MDETRATIREAIPQKSVNVSRSYRARSSDGRTPSPSHNDGDPQTIDIPVSEVVESDRANGDTKPHVAPNEKAVETKTSESVVICHIVFYCCYRIKKFTLPDMRFYLQEGVPRSPYPGKGYATTTIPYDHRSSGALRFFKYILGRVSGKDGMVGDGQFRDTCYQTGLSAMVCYKMI